MHECSVCFFLILAVVIIELRLDLSSSQGELAKACVAERIPFAGLTLSEPHSTKLEVMLTEFVLSLMQSEGSTYYRADSSAMASEVSKKRKHTGEEGQEDTGPKPKAKSKAKAKAKGTPTESQSKDTAAETEENQEPEVGEGTTCHGR